MSSSTSSAASANPVVHPSKCCRFCQKNLTCSGTKTPRISLFKVVKNKDLLAFTGTESVVVADIVESLGHVLHKHEELSQVSCLTCARTLTRIYATFKKLVARSNGEISSNAKRLCSNSPTGISPSAKRTREDGVRPRNSRRCLVLSDDRDLPQVSLQADKENLNPLPAISSLEDAMDGRKNMSTSETAGQKQLPSIMKVRFDSILFVFI